MILHEIISITDVPDSEFDAAQKADCLRKTCG